MILTCLAFSFFQLFTPKFKGVLSLVLPEKICHSLHARFVGPAELRQWNWCHFRGPSCPTRVSSLHPPSILGPIWSSLGIWNRSPCCMQNRSCLVRCSSHAEYQGERGLICPSIPSPPSVSTDCWESLRTSFGWGFHFPEGWCDSFQT